MKAAGLLLCIVCAGCDHGIVAPHAYFVSRRHMDPIPDWYANEYALMEECVGHPGDFAAVRWYIADVISFRSERLAGIVEFPHDITLAYAHYQNWGVVRHEAEHHIRQQGDEIHLPNGATPCQAYVP